MASTQNTQLPLLVPSSTPVNTVVIPSPANATVIPSHSVNRILPDVTQEIQINSPGKIPEEFFIENIRGHKQHFPLGCEAAAAMDWAKFFGVEINEFEFQYKLPLSDNPDFGFVGSVDSRWGQVPPYAYGVHAGPVAWLLTQYGLPSTGMRAYTIDLLKEQISRSRPVIAWVIGNVVGGVPYTFTDSIGRKTTVAAYEHVIIVTGYKKDKIRYMNNGRFYETPLEIFKNSWGILENMVVVRSE